MSTEPSRRQAVLALLLLVPVPSLATWAAMIAAEGPVGQSVFVAGKLWLWLLPAAWVALVERRRPKVPAPSRRGMTAAVLSGLFIVAAIALGYWAVGRHWIDAEFMRTRAEAIGLGTPLRYLAGAVYWCTVNSLLEEYVWRWFVFTRCEVLFGRAGAVVASALFFTLHHIVGLSVYFDWRVTALGSLGVFAGGAIWSWLYLRYRNIWAAYVSHVFADLIVFAIGWRLLFG